MDFFFGRLYVTVGQLVYFVVSYLLKISTATFSQGLCGASCGSNGSLAEASRLCHYFAGSAVMTFVAQNPTLLQSPETNSLARNGLQSDMTNDGLP